jgi:putative transcriptional regulator
MAHADEPPRAAPPVLNPELPAPLNRVALGRWWPVGIGISYRPLRSAGAAWGGLILAKPGRSLLRHGHAGLELTCILSGSFADGSGEYLAGDLSEPMADHDQPPLVTGTEPCLCIIASEGMRLRGLLGLAQRMIGQ